MFKINYQIIENEEDLQLLSSDELDAYNLEGNIELEVNDKRYGYYKKEPLLPGQEGFDLLMVWFDELLDILIKLEQQKNYVAFFVMDRYATWVEFRRLNIERVSISIIEYHAPCGTDLVITEEPKNTNPSFWSNEVVSYKELRDEILTKTNQYLDELVTINNAFMDSKTFMRFMQKIQLIRYLSA